MDDKMEDLSSESRMGFARRLASPKKKSREKAVSLLVLWLTSKKQLEDSELKKIWKGLFYCVWHSDKVSVQADLIERLASILEKLDIKLSLQFFKVFLVTMRREWAGIDRLRLDKFYLLLRKCLAHMLSALQKSGWRADSTREFMDIFVETALLASDQYAALGINLHYADIFLQELKNFFPIEVETFRLLLEPFLVVCARTSDKILLHRIKENIFEHLFNLGRVVITAKQDGNPVASLGETLGSLLLSLPFGSEAFKLASLPSTSQASRKVLYELHREFEKLENLLNTSGITLSSEKALLKKAKKKKNKYLGPVPVIEKKRKKGAQHEKTVNFLKLKSKSAYKKGIAATVSSAKREGSKSSSSVLKKSNRFPGSKEDERRSENSKSLVQESKDQPATGCKEKKRKKESSAKQKKVRVVDTSDEDPQDVLNGLVTDESVVSKLEKQFDLLVNDSLAKSDVTLLPSIEVLKTGSSQDTGNKKRTRQVTSEGIGNGCEAVELSASVAEKGSSTPSRAVKAGNSSGKVKKVRFALKKNLVWLPSTPLPAESVRVPPSATPRGSALKKGVSPGPIVSETANVVKNWKGTPVRIYKHRKNVLKHVKMPRGKELGGDVKREFGEGGKLFWVDCCSDFSGQAVW